MSGLSMGNRFVGIIRMAMEASMGYNEILKAMAHVFHFKTTDENGGQF